MKNLSNIINKVYVINLDKRTDRWENVQSNFKNTGLEFTRVSATNGTELDQNTINNNTTYFCRNFCTKSMIGIWLSHYKIWKQIYENKEKNVLILEDDAYPVQGFNDKLQKYWKKVPKDWDLLYLGCFGTCDKSIFCQNFFSLFGSKNKLIYDKNNKLCENIIVPGFPAGAHAYMLSYGGAKKLLESKELSKAYYHVDYALAKFFNHNPDFKVYAIYPSIIYQRLDANYSNNVSNYHILLSKLFSKIKISEQHSVDTLGSVQLLNLKIIDFSLTNFNVILMLLSLTIGLALKKPYICYYIFGILIIYLVEGIINVNKEVNIKNLGIELIFVLLFTLFGYYIRNS